MFLEILRFELKQQLKSPLLWTIAFALALLAFAAASSDNVQLGGGIGNVHRNAPAVVAEYLAFFTIFGLFLIPVFVAGAALRDFEAGTADLFFATPMPRSAYLGGRFVAGYLASAAVLVAVAVAFLVGTFMPWLDPERLGPTQWSAYGYGFAVFVLPNLFFLSALLFLLATLTRSLLVTYVGVIAFFVLYLVADVTLDSLEHRTLGAMLDPFGLGAMQLSTLYWSAQERNTRLPELAGWLLANRATWIAVAAVLLAAAFALFRPDREGFRWRRRKAAAEPGVAAAAAPAARTAVPRVTPATGFGARFTQWRRLAWFDMRGVLGGVGFIVMLAFGLMNLGGRLLLGNELFGTEVYPVTHLMTEAMDGSFTFLLVVVVMFYAGELVWRERAHRVSDVTDAFPLPDWIPLLAKFAALAAVIVLFLAAGAIECVVYQLSRGYTAIEPGLYLSNLVLTTLSFLLIAALALFFQAVSNNKFLGYLFIVLYMVSRILLPQLEYDHHLYSYGTAPPAPYSDMNGYGHFLAGHLWFRTYWASLAVALLVVAAWFWARGTADGWRARVRIARQRVGLVSGALFAAALVGFGALGGWIYYNTNVINRYVPGDLAKQLQADYEKTYAQYKDLPQPKITDVRTDVDIFPAERRVDVRGHYALKNKGDAPITDLHMRLPQEIALVSATFAPHKTVSEDARLGYTIWRLDTPLAPGASMDFDFVLRYESRGFRNTPNDTRVVGNGTFLDSGNFPHFGYDDGGQLQDRNDRRKYGLGPAPRMPKIDDEPARRYNLLGRDADWVTFETTVSTVPDQIALAPGYLEKEWTKDGRRYFHYKMDRPILGFFSFQSARYAVKRDRWNDVAVEVYYDPKHPYNVDRMIDATKKSLAYFSKAYAPYQYRQLRILEFPGYERFAQSFANTVPFSESIGFIADLRDPDDIDYVFYVTAHEVAHQWWAHQVIGAMVQGVTMLDETFAQYSALMVQEDEYGPAQMRKFLKYELDRYLNGRGSERVEEEPLALVENQPYIHYRKGSVILYALKDYLGRDTVDKVLAQYDKATAYQEPPYTTTREFLAMLRAEAGEPWNGLIEDLFEKITVYDNRVTEATATKRADGRYDVTLAVHAQKVHVDGVGKETPAKLDQTIDVGVFARAPDGKEANQKVLFLEKRRIADGDSSITITVDCEPFEAGVDPYNKLVDRVSEDNRARVALK